MKKAVSGIVLMLLLTSMLSSAFIIQPVEAEWTGTVYIRADGSIDPPTAPISTLDNITYTLTGNISSTTNGIIVERSNIIIDGAGYTLKGGWNGSSGIKLFYMFNITIKKINIQHFYYGILLHRSSNNIIKANNINNNDHGIYLYDYSLYNIISENNVTNNRIGIPFYYSSSNNVSRNTIVNNIEGIRLDRSLYNRISGNMFLHNGLCVVRSYENIVENNTVNGKPLIYLEGVLNYNVDDAGQVILIRSKNIRIEGLNLSRTDRGLQLLETTNSVITANHLANNNKAGIWLDKSSNNTISGNNITANNWYGIFIYESSNNDIHGNDITNNGWTGIIVQHSSNNNIFHNNFINNTLQLSRQVFSYKSINVWDDGYPSGGNYWSDYTGVDYYSGPYQNETGSDGIGDTPYVIDANNVDRHPLMEPWTPVSVLLKPDLSVSSQDISFSDSNPLEGEVITITAKVHNMGNGSARNVLVHFFDGTTLIGSREISFISYGSYGIASIDWTAKGEGFHPIKVVVDPYNTIVEADEGNNEATRSILVGAIPYMGGIILEGWVIPSEAYAGSRIRVQGNAIYNTTYSYGEPVAGAEVTITVVGWTQTKIYTIKDGTYKAEVTAPYTPGNYTVIVTITDFTFQESIELSLSVTRVEGIDLTLSGGDITFSPSDPLENQMVNITAKIHNIGTENAYNVNVSFYDGNNFIGGRKIDVIPAEESRDISVLWNATPWGWHTIRVVIDPENEIAETNENNNQASKSIYVYPPIPDLTPIDIVFSDNTPLVNQTVTVSAIVRNIGGVQANNILISFYHEDELIGNVTIASIPGRGGTATASTSYAFKTEGWHKMCVFADPDNVIAEADEENNKYCEIIYVHSPLPDLVISSSDITFSNETPLIGETITIYATIHNLGEVAAHNATVEIYADDSRIGYTTIDYIPEDGRETFSVAWNASPAGWHRIKVTVDRNNTIVELNENNNVATRCIYVYPELAPDLCIYSEDIVFSNVNPDPGELVTIFATVHNIGQADAYNVTVTFYVDDVQIGLPHSISYIPIGGEETVSTTWVASETGSHVVKVVADTPIEMDRKNNVATRGIIVGKQYFELTITSSPITGITFTINGTSQTTPYTENLLTGTYIIEMPETHNGYVWSHWLEDGDTNRTKTIALNQNATWTAVYIAVPPLSVSITPTTAEIKIGESVTFTSSVSGGMPQYSYQWYLNGSAVSGAQNPTWTFTPTTTGTYKVYLMVTDSLGNTAKSNEATVVVAPPLSVSISPMSASIIVGQSVTFTSTVSGGYAPYSYQWYLNGNPVSGATSASWTFTPITSGIYYVYLKVTDDKGNTAQSETARITVSAVPVGGYSYPINKYTLLTPIATHIALIAILTTIFITIKRKAKRKH